MYRATSTCVAVVPVATNLGLFWPQQDFEKHPGRATVEFLDPIMPGQSRGEFLHTLETAIETRRCQELIAEATGEPVRPSILVPAPGRNRPRRSEGGRPRLKRLSR